MRSNLPKIISIHCLLVIICFAPYENIMSQSDLSSPSFNNTLISVDKNIAVSDWSLTASDLGLEGDWSVNMVTLRGGKQEGVKLITMDNGALTFTVIPTRGMSVHTVEKGTLRLAWNSPVKELIHPQFIDLEANGGLGWLDGFNEWMTRCGMEYAGHPGMDNGRMLNLHGRIGNMPASEVEVIVDNEPPHRIRIRGKMNEVYFNGPNLELWTEISAEPGSAAVRFEDQLTNLSQKEQEFMVLYHANFGSPLLEPGSQLYGSIKKVVPFDNFAAEDIHHWNTYGGPINGIAERVYCIYPKADSQGNAHFLLQNSGGDQGVSFSYEVEQLPYFTQWKNQDSDGYVTGLEPGTGFPHNRSIERKYGRVPVLAPGGERVFRIDYLLHTDKNSVTAVRNKLMNEMSTVEISKEVISK